MSATMQTNVKLRQVKIMSGVPGSGKSTLARKLADAAISLGKPKDATADSVRIVSADDYFMRDGKYMYDISKIGEAHNECMREFLRACATDTDFIVVDNTSTTAIEIAPYVLVGEALGYKVEIIQVKCDPMVAHARNTHKCPLETVMNLHQNLQTRMLPPWWALRILEVP